MSNYPGRIISKSNATITTTQASGIWTLQQALQAIKSGVWPGIGSTVTTSFTASGYWTAPAGVTSVDYLVVAGGAGGGADGTYYSYYNNYYLLVGGSGGAGGGRGANGSSGSQAYFNGPSGVTYSVRYL